MRARPGGTGRIIRTGAALLVLAVLAIGVSAASAQPTYKYYSASVTPASVGPRSTTAFLVKLTNCGGTGTCTPASNTSFGSANISVPSGFTVDTSNQPAVNLPGWRACLGNGTTCGASPNNVVQLRNPSGTPVAAGGSVVVTVSATAPCTTGPYTWNTIVKQSNDFNGSGNNFNLSGSQPQVTVSSGASTVDHFAIALPSSPFTATAGTAFQPTITALDKCNNTVSSFNDSVGSLTGNLGSTSYPAPNGSAPTYPSSPISFSNGVATPSVTAVAAGGGNNLTFTATGYTPVTTADFTVDPGAPDHVLFTEQPLSAGRSYWTLNTNGQLTGTLTTFGAQVTIYDAFGNQATQVNSGNVQLTLNQPPGTSGGGGSLSTSSLTPTAGVVTFTGTVSKTGVPYTLTAGYGNGVATDTSDPFDVYLTIPDCSTGNCSFNQIQTDGNTVVGGTTSGGTFTFFAVASFDGPSASSLCAGFKSVYAKVGGGGVLQSDTQTASNGQVVGSTTFVYSVPMSLIQARYGKNTGQQVIPICAGAQRAQVVDGQVVPVPCSTDVPGWTSKVLDANGQYTGALAPARCDPTTGLYWGILPSFQDKGVPAGNPLITGWSSGNINGTNYRSFTVYVPAPWDYKMTG